jgi:hypothetical protein
LVGRRGLSRAQADCRRGLPRFLGQRGATGATYRDPHDGRDYAAGDYPANRCHHGRIAWARHASRSSSTESSCARSMSVIFCRWRRKSRSLLSWDRQSASGTFSMSAHEGAPRRRAGGLGRRLGTWASARSGIAQHGLLGGLLGHESSSSALGTAPPSARSSAAACFLLVWLRADQARPYAFFPRAMALSRGPSGLIGWISAVSTREG